MSHTDTDSPVQVIGLRKAYDGRPALDGVSFAIRRGEIFAYLGPNGAGKTTTVHILCGLLDRDAGDVRICGADVRDDPLHVKARIGVVTDSSNLYPELTCRRNLEYLGELYGLTRRARRGRAEELLATFDLADRARDRFDALSRGLQRRLTIAAALVHQPEVLFLDEPSVGLDVPSARALRELIRAIHRRGTTVLLTTHNLAEAESLADRVAILVHGRIVAQDVVAAIRRRSSKSDLLLVEFASSVDADALRARCPAVLAIRSREAGWELQVDDLPNALGQLADFVRQEGARIVELHVGGASLEDVFLSLLAEENSAREKTP